MSGNTSSSCGHNLTTWHSQMDKMYSYFYLLLFIPGLLLNTIALWVLCRYISKKTKAVIFMINLALADLVHILSLPLRIYYYFTHSWPFGRGACLFCFYLKFFNMYAAIVFLVCISMQRWIFLLKPFTARQWRRRYDLLISVIVWVLVGLACSPFILMRTSNTSESQIQNLSYTQQPLAYTAVYATVGFTPMSRPPPSQVGCFKDLPMRHVRPSMAITIAVLAELFGFFIPLACITYSSLRIVHSLMRNQDEQKSTSLNSAARSRLQSVTSNSHSDKYHDRQTDGEKRRALRMVLACFALFLCCFAPYHLNFLLYLMVSQDIVTHCATRQAVLQFHPVSLCMASLSCCVNPLLYYFLTAEFRLHLARRTSSFSSSLLSSPIHSPSQRAPPCRILSMESYCSDREEH